MTEKMSKTVLQASVQKKDEVPDDPWGNAYEYRVSGGDIEIISLGADGRQGGAGEDGDVSN